MKMAPPPCSNWFFQALETETKLLLINRSGSVSSVGYPAFSWPMEANMDSAQRCKRGRKASSPSCDLGRQFRWLGPQVLDCETGKRPMNFKQILCRFHHFNWNARVYLDSDLCSNQKDSMCNAESGCSCHCVGLSRWCQSASSTSSHPRVVDTAESWKSRLAVPCCCSLPQIHIVIVWSVHSINN